MPKYRVVKGVESGRVVTILDNVNDMLDRAGYFDRNGDGWRDTPSGSSFRTMSLTWTFIAETEAFPTSPVLSKYVPMSAPNCPL